MKVAIVYDRVNKWGGAERVLLELHNIFPDAPLYTSVYDKKAASWAKAFPMVYTSFLQKIPFAKQWHEGFGWLMPLVFESFNFDKYELVISVTSEAAKGIITKPKTLHICYMLTPTRYLWSHYEFYFKNPILRFISKPIISYLKFWDNIAAQRPDEIIAISTEVQKRIKKYYSRESQIVFPPVSSPGLKTLSSLKQRKNFYLVVSRLVSYKRVDFVVDTFNRLGKKLVIVGTGSEESRLKFKSKKNIEFVGEVSENELAKYYRGAMSLIMPQEEDFGIVSVESQSFGVPVIAFKKSGALDTVIDGVTGLFFDEQNIGSLVEAIAKCEKMVLNRKLLIENAKKFSSDVFRKKLGNLIK